MRRICSSHRMVEGRLLAVESTTNTANTSSLAMDQSFVSPISHLISNQKEMRERERKR